MSTADKVRQSLKLAEHKQTGNEITKRPEPPKRIKADKLTPKPKGPKR